MDRPFFILIVLDGFGCRADREWNAIAQASTPTLSRLFEEEAWTTVEASGLRVGLPEGQMGNSEVGHLNIGAGRVVDQDIVRISKAVDAHELRRNANLVAAFDRVKKDNRAVHFVGLLSDGGVHSLQDHLHGLIDAAVANGIGEGADGPQIFVHAILDGRDTPPVSAVANLQRLLDYTSQRPAVRLASVIGRYYTMDRDRRWERTRRGYDLMVLGVGIDTSNPIGCVERFYEAGKTDEFMEPIAVVGQGGAHRGKISDGDLVVFFNFRADRMRQIVASLYKSDFDGFEREVWPKVELMSMVRYREDFAFPVAFPPIEIPQHLGEVFSAQGMKQLRIAETEKYAHVTFFFNGGSDQPSPGEERILIPSPKIATYDLQPEMSVMELSDRVVQEIESGAYDVVIMNIANPDMVGHTGVMPAAITAVEATDKALGAILEATAKRNGLAAITADHGNCEIMYDPETGQPHTAHTNSPVPFILVDPERRYSLRGGGSLGNVAPTILEALGMEKPAEMEAESLLQRRS